MLTKIDIGVLGSTMLQAARAERIGVTLTLIDPLPPRNVYVSEAAAELVGWSVEELLERDAMQAIAPEDLPRTTEQLGRRVSGELGENRSEIVVVRKDGERAVLEVTASPVTIEGKRAIFAFMVDVSARRAAEQQRLHNEARFRELIERAPEPIGIIRDGRFVYANRAYVLALGASDVEALYQTPISSIVEPADLSSPDSREAAFSEHELRAGPATYRLRRRDGDVVLLEVTSVSFEYEGRPSVLTMGRDVTARKRLETQLAQAERLAALGTLAAGVAHEINNPLAYMMLNLEWIARHLPAVGGDPAILEGLMARVQEARDGASRVSTIVHELRSFSRADGEARHPVDLASAVQAAIKLTAHETRRARVTTSFELTRPVWANEARLEQVVINLLMNAMQAMPRGQEENRINIAVREDADGRAVLEVVDNGEGIPADVLPRIFDPFFTTRATATGTGLGLSICHGIVTSLGGQIAAYSEPGQGAAFRVVLPTAQPARDDPAATSQGAQP